MLAIFLAPVYILANVFTAYWLLRWMKEVHPLFRHPAVLGVILVLYAFFALSLLTSFLIKRDPVHRILKVISNCWLGMYLYFLGFRDSGAAALHFCAYGTDENLAVFSDGIESGRPWRDPFCDGNVHLRNGACSPYLHDTI